MFTEVTRVYSLCTESSSSFLSLASLTLILNGIPRTPWAQMALFRRVSILTSLVPICFSANFLISLTALGALYLNPIPCSLLCMLIVYSRVTTSPMVEPCFFEYGQRATFAIWIWAIFFAFCGNFVLLPTATAQCFGTANSSKNYGLVMTGSAAAAPILAILTQGLSPLMGFLGMFILIACFSAVAAILTLSFPVCPSPRKILEKLEESSRRPTNL